MYFHGLAELFRMYDYQVLCVPETTSALSVYLKRQAQGIPEMDRGEQLASVTIKLRDPC